MGLVKDDDAVEALGRPAAGRPPDDLGKPAALAGQRRVRAEDDTGAIDVLLGEVGLRTVVRDLPEPIDDELGPDVRLE